MKNKISLYTKSKENLKKIAEAIDCPVIAQKLTWKNLVLSIPAFIFSLPNYLWHLIKIKEERP